MLHVVYLYYIGSFLHLTSFSFFHEDVELISQDFLINAILTVFLIASQGNYLQSGKNVVIQRLTKSKKLLEENYALLEEQNAMMNKYAKHLEKTNSELEKFASVASHDLKAPLRAIGNLTDIIEDEAGHLLNDEMQSHFKVIKSRVLRMDALLNALLEYSKADKNSEEYREIAMQPFFEEQLNAVRENIAVHLKFETDLPMVFGERNKLAKAIRNLLHNAIIFNDKDSVEISIAVSDEYDHWLFAIHDNGPGIEARYHEKVFVIFQTLNRRDEKETMGIGLAVARKIIEERGGKIWLDNVQGSGTSVHFTIPKFSTNPNLLQPAGTATTITFTEDNIWLADKRPNLN
jgi:light-regulated signal transduction histidine kinase (bacteriophytochrome)